MRILYLYQFPLYGNGSGSSLRNIAGIIARTNKVAILAPDERSLPRIKRYVAEPPQIPVFVGHPELKKSKKFSELTSREILELYCYYLKKVVEVISEFKPNFIDVQHSHFLTWVARDICALYHIPFSVYVHGSDLHAIQLDRRYHALTRDALKWAKKIIVNSGYSRQWLLHMFPNEFNSKKKVRTIAPGGVNMNNFPESISLRHINSKYKLNGKKVVLFTGRLTNQKGTKYLVKAARKIKGEVVILGDGPEQENLKQLVEERKLNNVHLMGYVGYEHKRELKEWYYRADVLVAPSVWDEPLGLSIVEAMAAKTPIVATRKGGIPSAVRDNYNGILVRPRNSNQIAEAVNKILYNDHLREKMADHAREIVKQKFTREIIAQKFIHIYEKYVFQWNNKNKNNEEKK